MLSYNQNFGHKNIVKKQLNSSNKNIQIVTVSTPLLSKSRNLEHKNIIQKQVNSSNNHIRINTISTPFYKNKNLKCNNTKMKQNNFRNIMDVILKSYLSKNNTFYNEKRKKQLTISLSSSIQGFRNITQLKQVNVANDIISEICNAKLRNQIRRSKMCNLKTKKSEQQEIGNILKRSETISIKVSETHSAKTDKDKGNQKIINTKSPSISKNKCSEGFLLDTMEQNLTSCSKGLASTTHKCLKCVYLCKNALHLHSYKQCPNNINIDSVQS